MGEEVTLAEHMLQTAHFARQDGASDELIAAALLHDIGHFGDEFRDDIFEKGGDNFHEKPAATCSADIFRPPSPNRFACMSPPSDICARPNPHIFRNCRRLRSTLCALRAVR